MHADLGPYLAGRVWYSTRGTLNRRAGLTKGSRCPDRQSCSWDSKWSEPARIDRATKSFTVLVTDSWA